MAMQSEKRLKFFRSDDDNMAFKADKTPLIIRFYDPDIKGRDAYGRTLDDILHWQNAKLETCHNYIQMLFPLPEGSPFNWEAPVIDRQVMETFHSRTGLKNSLRRSFERMLDFYGFAVSREPEKESLDQEKREGKQDTACLYAEAGAESKANGNATDAKENTEEKNENELAADLKSEHSVTLGILKQGTAATEREGDDGDAHPIEAPMGEANGASTIGTLASSAGPRPQTTSRPLTGFCVVRAPHWQRAFCNWAIRFDHNHLRITRILRCLRVLGLQVECEAFYKALKEVFSSPQIRINERSMMYWRRAVRQPLHVAPDGGHVSWLRNWEERHASGAAEMDTDDESH